MAVDAMTSMLEPIMIVFAGSCCRNNRYRIVHAHDFHHHRDEQSGISISLE